MDYPDRVAAHADKVRAIVRQNGRGLLRYESEEDLVQGAIARALAGQTEAGPSEDDAFAAWIATLTRRHLADRADWWRALKRGSSRILRLSWSGSQPGDPLANLIPRETVTGPGTLAGRREAVTRLSRAVDLLSPRDQELVGWYAEGVSLADQADRLEVSYGAVQRASLRALERLGKTFRLLSEPR